MLSDTEIRKAKPGLKPVKLFDGLGLYLLVQPTGSRLWRLKYRFEGKEKLLSLGAYPEVPLAGRWLDEAKRKAKDLSGYLKGARDKRDEARELIAVGVDPSAARKAESAARVADVTGSFEAVAREFHAVKKGGWSESHAKRWLERMQNDVFPYLGALPLAEVKAPEVLKVVRRIEARGAVDSTRKALESIGQVFRYGISTSRCSVDVTYRLSEALKPAITRNYAAIVEPGDLGALLRSIAAYRGTPIVRAALALTPLVFQRPGNIRAMEWGEVDLDLGMWTIPALKLKGTVQRKATGRPHLVPLAPQAVEILRELQPLSGHRQYVFSGMRDHEAPMSDAALCRALTAMGYPRDAMRAHSFRAVARTLLVERLGVDPEVVEAQLAHGKSGPLGGAYDRAQYLEQRRAAMVAWADYLDTLRVEKASHVAQVTQ